MPAPFAFALRPVKRWIKDYKPGLWADRLGLANQLRPTTAPGRLLAALRPQEAAGGSWQGAPTAGYPPP